MATAKKTAESKPAEEDPKEGEAPEAPAEGDQPTPDAPEGKSEGDQPEDGDKPKGKGKRLASFVHVGGKVYGPNDDVPADVAKQITNEKAWA